MRRIIPLLALTASLVALAQSSGGSSTNDTAASGREVEVEMQEQQQPPPPKKKAKKEASCPEQCDMMVQPLEKSCARPGMKKEAAGACRSQAKKMSDACYGSCQEKGRIDPEYMKKKLMPKGAGAPHGH